MNVCNHFSSNTKAVVLNLFGKLHTLFDATENLDNCPKKLSKNLSKNISKNLSKNYVKIPFKKSVKKSFKKMWK